MEFDHIASAEGLITKPYKIVYFTPDEMNNIHQAGYKGRFIAYESSVNDDVLELFEVGQPHHIYLNKNNTTEENIFALAHCMGHIDFASRNQVLGQLKLPKLTHKFVHSILANSSIDYIHNFIETMRQLAITTESLNERLVAPLSFFIKKQDWFKSWELQLLNEIKVESHYFERIRRTKLMNEGWASYCQMSIISRLGLGVSQKLKMAQLEARMHNKPEEGLNLYSLGKAMWENVQERERTNVLKYFDDLMFIEKYYTKVVHDHERLSVVTNQTITNDYREVKKHLLQYFKYQTPYIYLDQDVTRETGFITLRYITDPYQIDISHINNVRASLEYILNQRVYIKPLI